jgi:hypothetical protein
MTRWCRTVGTASRISSPSQVLQCSCTLVTLSLHYFYTIVTFLHPYCTVVDVYKGSYAIVASARRIFDQQVTSQVPGGAASSGFKSRCGCEFGVCVRAYVFVFVSVCIRVYLFVLECLCVFARVLLRVWVRMRVCAHACMRVSKHCATVCVMETSTIPSIHLRPWPSRSSTAVWKM